MHAHHVVDSKMSLELLQSGASLCVDKPLGWTSFDVVNKLRWAIRNALNVKKYKVGHAGTLDPLATGLLIVCIGKHTKKIELYQGLDKSYTGSIQLFATTKSYDTEFLPDAYFPHRGFSLDELREAASKFEGDIDQYPPVFSAIKKNGRPLYKLARKGQIRKEQLESRPVHINKFEIIEYRERQVTFEVSCSKGTYIRSLAYDFGKALDTGAYLTELRRTAIGDFTIDEAWQLEDLVDEIKGLKSDMI